MATVTLSTASKFRAGTTIVSHGEVLVRDGANADQLVLPAAAPVGFAFKAVQKGAGTMTFAAGTGATLVAGSNAGTAVTGTVVDIVNSGTATAAAWIACIYE